MKVSDCRILGEIIALLWLHWLKDVLMVATVNSKKKFWHKMFVDVAHILIKGLFLDFLFKLCKEVYAQMMSLHLGDQKTAGMDKLIQAYYMLNWYLQEVSSAWNYFYTST